MLSYQFDTEELSRELGGLIKRIGDGKAVHEIVGLALLDQHQIRFRKGVSPDGDSWDGLSALTLLTRRSSKGILRDRGELFRSIHHKSSSDRAEVGTNLNHPKVMVHQHGAVIKPRNAKRLRVPTGHNSAVYLKQVTIKARPYIGIGVDDGERVKEGLIGYLEG